MGELECEIFVRWIQTSFLRCLLGSDLVPNVRFRFLTSLEFHEAPAVESALSFFC